MRRKSFIICVFIIFASILMGCDKESANLKFMTKREVAQVKKDLNNQDKEEANLIKILDDDVKLFLDDRSKIAFSVYLTKGEYINVTTDTNYPITVMLKDNSMKEYIHNITMIPQGYIVTDTVKKDGEYELMIDFNEIENFNYDIYIVN